MSGKGKRILFQFSFVAVSLLFIEIILRYNGYKPGDIKPNWLNFHPVDSLYEIPDFYINAEGILIADSNRWAKKNIHINEDGFRSPDFAKIDSTKKSILFIGDSFTWGMSANPLVDSCFADLLRHETNYEIINLGIPVADPVQYAALAKKYISQLKHDYVLVMFFTGNDLMKEDRKIILDEPFYYYTNAGAIMADVDGLHFKTAQAAYNYFVNERYYLHQPKNIFEKIISTSSLLSRLYSVRFRISEKLEKEQVIKDSRISKKYLKQINAIAQQNHVPVRFVLIPEIKEADLSIEKYRQKYNDLLGDSILKNDWLVLQNSEAYFNDYPDGHLNNAGHRHYADYLKSVLDNYFAKKINFTLCV